MDKITPHGKNIVVYDLETKNPISGQVTWDRHDLMGISVGVAYHYLTGETHIFMDDNLEDLPKLLNQADIVSGFNILRFDHKLLNATTKTKYTNEANTYDLLLESIFATGWKTGKAFPKGMRLDDHLHGTFGEDFVKTANGAEAPHMWQKKELGKLISYCVADVRRECMLFERVWAELPVTTALHGQRVLRHPLRARRSNV
jgi:hypothetical protein